MLLKKMMIVKLRGGTSRKVIIVSFLRVDGIGVRLFKFGIFGVGN